MEFTLNDFHRNIPDQELLDDLKRVADKLCRNKFSSREYEDSGKYTIDTIIRRFGTWNKALQKAGLEITLEQNQNLSDKQLFENIEEIWINLGRQPAFRDVRQPASKYSVHQYLNKFRTWRKALEAFVEFINSGNDQNQDTEKIEPEETIQDNKIIFKHKTKRIPSNRLKVQVLMRDGKDGIKCRLCGIPLTGDNIHYDHILAWSKGGETVLENLQILCAPHNLAKGNLEYGAK